MQINVAVVQTSPERGRPGDNLEKALALMEGVRADAFVLPELAFTGYNFFSAAEARSLSEPAGEGSVFEAILDVARTRRIVVAYGFAERAGGDLFNAASLVGPGGLVGVYRKVHLFDREKLIFKPGDGGFPVFDLAFGKAGIMICFDWYYPEAARSLALAGARVIFHPSNLVLPHCPEAMVTRCLENRVFAATANRVGTEDGGEKPLTFIGSSQVVSPKGEIMARLGRQEVGVAVAPCDLELAAQKKVTSRNDLFADRRPDQYGLS